MRERARAYALEMSNTKVTEQDARRLSQLAQNYADEDAEAVDDLLEELAGASVVASEDVGPTVVTMNSRVSCRDEAGRLREFQIVYPRDANVAAGRISVLAPLGRALLGAAVGDLVTPTTGGRRLSWVVEAIGYQPEAAGDHHL